MTYSGRVAVPRRTSTACVALRKGVFATPMTGRRTPQLLAHRDLADPLGRGWRSRPRSGDRRFAEPQHRPDAGQLSLEQRTGFVRQACGMKATCSATAVAKAKSLQTISAAVASAGIVIVNIHGADSGHRLVSGPGAGGDGFRSLTRRLPAPSSRSPTYLTQNDCRTQNVT